jgi:hypothetical protein
MGAVRQCALRKSRASHVGFGSKLGHPGDVRCMTDLPPKADVHPRGCYVAEVPYPDTHTASLGRY